MNLTIIMPPTASMPLVSGGGVERLCELFLRENDSSPSPYEITVISRYDEQSEAISSKYEHTKFLYVRIPRSEPPSNELLSKLTGKNLRHDYISGVKKLLKGLKSDEVILENCFEYACDVYKKTKIKPILHAHSRFFGEDKGSLEKGLKFIKKFVFVSEFLKNSATRCGVPEEKSFVLKNCVDTEEFNPQRFTEIRHKKREQYSLSDDDILVIFVGRLTPGKGALELVKAISHSEYKDSRLKLLIVGSAQYGVNIHDDYRNELEVAAAKNRVIFIGSVKSASTARFLARADIAVIPSVFDEPAGLTVLEALSSGLPIIVTDSGGIPEYTRGLEAPTVTEVKRGIGLVGSLTRAVDALAKELHDSPSKREEIRKASRTHAEKFSVRDYVEDFRGLIEQ